MIAVKRDEDIPPECDEICWKSLDILAGYEGELQTLCYAESEYQQTREVCYECLGNINNPFRVPVGFVSIENYCKDFWAQHPNGFIEKGNGTMVDLPPPGESQAPVEDAKPGEEEQKPPPEPFAQTLAPEAGALVPGLPPRSTVLTKLTTYTEGKETKTAAAVVTVDGKGRSTFLSSITAKAEVDKVASSIAVESSASLRRATLTTDSGNASGTGEATGGAATTIKIGEGDTYIQSSENKAWIAGVAVGSLAVICMIIGLVIFMIHRKRKNRQLQAAEERHAAFLRSDMDEISSSYLGSSVYGSVKTPGPFQLRDAPSPYQLHSTCISRKSARELDGCVPSVYETEVRDAEQTSTYEHTSHSAVADKISPLSENGETHGYLGHPTASEPSGRARSYGRRARDRRNSS